MSTIRVVNVQHTDATEPNIVLESDGTAVFASGITISGGTNLTISGTAEFASGTAAAPKITFIDDNNTGIYEPAVDTVAITTSGTERLRVDSSGNVGIGTSSPSEVLDLRSTGTTRIFFESNDGGSPEYRATVGVDSAGFKIQTRDGTFGNNTDRLTIDTSGNVGIGTTSPASQLHLNNSAGTGQLRITSQANSEGLTISVRNDGNGSQLSARGTSSHLRFYTANASNTLYERMRIDDAGRLLLGTDTNGYNNARLQIAGTNSNNYLSILNTTASDLNDYGWAVIAFRRTQSGGEVSTSAGITGRHDGTGDDQKGKLEIGTNDGNDNNGFQVRMEMDSAGYVRLTSQSPGMQFNGDTAAANALDDYEEGTFTPTLTFATPGTSSFGYTAQTGGRYTKIGRFVHCRIEIRLNAFSKGTASGDLQIDDLPFSATGGGSFGQFIGNFASFQTPLPTAAGNFPIVLVLLNQNKAQFKVIVNNANWATFPDPDSNSQYKIDLQYYV